MAGDDGGGRPSAVGFQWRLFFIELKGNTVEGRRWDDDAGFQFRRGGVILAAWWAAREVGT
jgi:hypothetical protein